MLLVVRKGLAFLKKDLLVQMSYRFAILLNLVAIVFGVAAYYFLSKLFNDAGLSEFQAYGSGYFSFILIGVACYSYMNVAIGTFSSNVRQAQTQGTLEAMMLTRTNLTTILVLSSLWAFFYTISQLIFYIIVGWLLFDFDVASINISSTSILIFIIAISFCPLGILSASFILAFKKGDPVFFGISTLSALLGGVYYPVSVLPEWLQSFSKFLPITVALDGLRKTIAMGYTEAQILPEIGHLLLLTLVLSPLALVSFQLAVRRSKVMGTISHF